MFVLCWETLTGVPGKVYSWMNGPLGRYRNCCIIKFQLDLKRTDYIVYMRLHREGKAGDGLRLRLKPYHSYFNKTKCWHLSTTIAASCYFFVNTYFLCKWPIPWLLTLHF